MRYWDASALVPVCVRESSTDALRRLLGDQGMVTWCLSAVEIASAIERRARSDDLDSGARIAALRNLYDVRCSWTEITAVAAVRERALRLLAAHALRAADSLQLAAALVAIRDRPGGQDFVCLDGRLRDAAQREGFRILP